jgi:transposase
MFKNDSVASPDSPEYQTEVQELNVKVPKVEGVMQQEIAHHVGIAHAYMHNCIESLEQVKALAATLRNPENATEEARQELVEFQKVCDVTLKVTSATCKLLLCGMLETMAEHGIPGARDVQTN